MTRAFCVLCAPCGVRGGAAVSCSLRVGVRHVSRVVRTGLTKSESLLGAGRWALGGRRRPVAKFCIAGVAAGPLHRCLRLERLAGQIEAVSFPRLCDGSPPGAYAADGCAMRQHARLRASGRGISVVSSSLLLDAVRAVMATRK